MKQLAQDVWQLEGRPENNINVYIVGDVLIDAGTPWTPAGSSSSSKGARSPPTP